MLIARTGAGTEPTRPGGGGVGGGGCGAPTTVIEPDIPIGAFPQRRTKTLKK